MKRKYRHWRLQQQESGVARLHFDHADSSVNILCDKALTELEQVLDSLGTETTGLIILSDKANGFIAGTDVNGFVAINSIEDMRDHIRRVHALFMKLERQPFPTLALIHGFCLGGGLELALACDYRIARDDPTTRIGFPEVRLGIFPGYGGTARELRILPPLAALKLTLGGGTIDGRKAARMGLVDGAVPERQMENAAMALLQHGPRQRKRGLTARLMNRRPLRTLLAWLMERETAKRVRRDHYPAPFALIDHWRRCGDNFERLLRGEVERVPELMSGDSSRNLIRAFFLQERLKGLAGDSDFRAAHVHVVGGGVMGGDIAAWCALKGLRVTLQDREARFLTRAVGRAHQLFKRKLKDTLSVRAAMDRLMPDPKGYGIARADVIIEAIFENLEAKRHLFQEIEAKAKPGAILASNTSSIPLREIAAVMRQPQRLIGLHFFNPVARMQLVEIVHEHDTDSDAVAKGTAFAKGIGKLPVPVKSRPGFLVNRILMPYLLEAVAMFDEGISPGAIDRAATAFGMPMGPVELADKVGLDICLAVAEELAAHYPFKVPDGLRLRVEAGKLGQKSGEGFYRYRNGRAMKTGSEKFSTDMADRLIFRLLNEAVACLREGIVEDGDLLDAGIIFGTGFAPFRGGPIHYIAEGGLDRMRERLADLERRHGSQFHADLGWNALSKI